MYNDLGDFDEHNLVRKFLDGIGYVWCSFGIIRVVGDGHGLNDVGYVWSAILCGLITTTMHIQDLLDQESDRLIDRSTAPLLWVTGLLGGQLLWHFSGGRFFVLPTGVLGCGIIVRLYSLLELFATDCFQ